MHICPCVQTLSDLVGTGKVERILPKSYSHIYFLDPGSASLLFKCPLTNCLTSLNLNFLTLKGGPGDLLREVVRQCTWGWPGLEESFLNHCVTPRPTPFLPPLCWQLVNSVFFFFKKENPHLDDDRSPVVLPWLLASPWTSRCFQGRSFLASNGTPLPHTLGWSYSL